MSTFIEKISQGAWYDPRLVVGYTDKELEKIEKLYDIEFGGEVRKFMREMGRSDGGLIGDDPIVLYRNCMGVRDFVLLQSGIQEEIYGCGFHDLASNKPFVFSIESETQFFFIATASENIDSVYQYDENNNDVIHTGLDFVAYMQKAVLTWGDERAPICKGELILL